MRYNGARRARRRGLANADFQAKMNATSYNLKKWMQLLRLRERKAERPRTGGKSSLALAWVAAVV